MVNWRFLREQFKAIWVQVLIFSIVFVIIALIPIIFSNFGGMKINMFDKGNDPKKDLILDFASLSGQTILNSALFGFSGLVVFFSFGIAINTILVNRDISRGYITSWLITPMSRNKIFNTKLVLLLLITLFLHFCLIVVEMIFYSITMPDFKNGVGLLLFGNFALILFSFLVVSMTWIGFCIFQKNGIAILVLMAILGWFYLCQILTIIAEEGTTNENLKYFRYFSVASLLNSPLQFSKDFPEILRQPGKTVIQYAEPLPIKALDFAWQLPVIFLGATGLFIGGQQIIQRKDFTF